jgi:hypothetical protein
MATQSSLRAPGPRIKLPSIVNQSARKATKIAVYVYCLRVRPTLFCVAVLC